MIFYFTGTGNSLYAAEALDPQCRSIPQVMHHKKLCFQAETIGLVCPVYGHEMPAMVKEFVQKARFDTPYLYVVLTYGNRAANAAELAADVFARAGKHVDYVHTLLMVDNFLPAFDMTEQKAMNKHVEEQLEKIRQDIAARKKEIEEVTDKQRAQHAQYVFSVHGQPETIWAQFDFTDACVGCGICTRVCPGGCIHLEQQRAVRDPQGCQACFACIHACPQDAIRMREVLGYAEKNPQARYRNEHVSLGELIAANEQGRRERR
jgi:ferredoxin